MGEQGVPPKSNVVGPTLGLAICACLFVVTMFGAAFTMFTHGGSSSPLLEFALLVPVIGFVLCLIWLAAEWAQKRREK